MSEHGKRAVVTGAASGIGAATVTLLLQRGWRVACLDRDLAGMRRVASGQPCIAVDVADEAGVVAAFAQVRDVFGELDALAACAGIFDATPLAQTDTAIFRKVLDVNVVGTFLCLREAAQLMQAGGRICTVASVAGLRGGGLMGTMAYATSKGAVLALTKNAARMLGPQGIAVNTIAPGAIDTPFTAGPLADPPTRQRVAALSSYNRLGTAAEVAEGIVWLLSDAASFVHGATLVVDGGLVMY